MLYEVITVSLTEDPEYEAPVAISLVKRYNNRKPHDLIKPISVITSYSIHYTKLYEFHLLEMLFSDTFTKNDQRLIMTSCLYVNWLPLIHSPTIQAATK